MCHILQSIDTSKAYGPDGLPSRILKECGQFIIPPNFIVIHRKQSVERCIFNPISQHMQSNIHSAQFGFVKGRSCATQLLSTLNTVGKNLDNGLQTDVVFMDIAKAFMWMLAFHKDHY